MGQIGRLAPCVCVALMLTPNLCHSNETIVPDALRQKGAGQVQTLGQRQRRQARPERPHDGAPGVRLQAVGNPLLTRLVERCVRRRRAAPSGGPGGAVHLSSEV